MPQKSKLSVEEKVKIVEGCINGENSSNRYAEQYHVDNQTIRCWIRLYQARGIEGLIPATKTKKYSIELKKCAVEDYLSGQGSLRVFVQNMI